MNILQELLAISESKMKPSTSDDEKAIAWLKENFKFDSEYGGSWPASKIWEMMKGTADNREYIKIPYVKMKRFDIPDAPFDLKKAFKNLDQYVERYACIYAPPGVTDGLDHIIQLPQLGNYAENRGEIIFDMIGKAKIKSFKCSNPAKWKYSKISFEHDVSEDRFDCGWLSLLKLDALTEIDFRDLGGGTDLDDDISEVSNIINKCLKGNRNIIDCQSELIDAGFEKYAEL